jgi:uncharacterized cofD-like protein
MKHVVLFSGGTAARSLNVALCGDLLSVTRIVPAWDSGGSSKAIRDRLDVLAVGDLRQALMTMAHGEGRVGAVVKICNSRLSSDLGKDEARKEFVYFSRGKHPLLERMEPGLRGAILNYLRTFNLAVRDDFDFRNGSVGNFILTGACLAHNGDINTAVFVFRKICEIRGNAWLSSTDSDLELSAVLNDGTSLPRQDMITKMPPDQAVVGVKSIELSGAGRRSSSANPAAVEAIQKAEMIVFGPGSFYTSLMPHLHVDGIADAVERASCPKVLVTNILQCPETLGATLSPTLTAVDANWRGRGRASAFPFTHVIANRVLFPFEKTVGTFPYFVDDVVAVGNIEIIRGEFEDAWSRGQHDGNAVAKALITILENSGSPPNA